MQYTVRGLLSSVFTEATSSSMHFLFLLKLPPSAFPGFMQLLEHGGKFKFPSRTMNHCGELVFLIFQDDMTSPLILAALNYS